MFHFTKIDFVIVGEQKTLPDGLKFPGTLGFLLSIGVLLQREALWLIFLFV